MITRLPSALAGVATRSPPEAVVVADHDLASPQPPEQHVLHESLRLDRGQLSREREHDDGVDSGLADQGQALVEGRDGSRCPVRLQDLHGMGIEGARDRLETGRGRGMGFRDSNQDLLGFVHMRATALGGVSGGTDSSPWTIRM